MNKLQDTGLLVARILMPIIFIVAGYGKWAMPMPGPNNICKRWAFLAFPATDHFIGIWWWPGHSVWFPDPHHLAVHCRVHSPDSVYLPH